MKMYDFVVVKIKVVTRIYILINKALLFFSPLFFLMNLLCPAVHV